MNSVKLIWLSPLVSAAWNAASSAASLGGARRSLESIELSSWRSMKPELSASKKRKARLSIWVFCEYMGAMAVQNSLKEMEPSESASTRRMAASASSLESPILRIASPSSLVSMTPLPSTSKAEKASFISPTTSSLRGSTVPVLPAAPAAASPGPSPATIAAAAAAARQVRLASLKARSCPCAEARLVSEAVSPLTQGMASSCDAEGRLAAAGASSALTTALASPLTSSHAGSSNAHLQARIALAIFLSSARPSGSKGWYPPNRM
mmetsp:Transcript_75512/g.182539  ORF Transcript_75512/g.182539 Transcript_75512/m.182539 type:complete len:265 (+) Transcript_75512:397-1191(+)